QGCVNIRLAEAPLLAVRDGQAGKTDERHSPRLRNLAAAHVSPCDVIVTILSTASNDLDCRDGAPRRRRSTLDPDGAPDLPGYAVRVVAAARRQRARRRRRGRVARARPFGHGAGAVD